jgi:sigma-B regulation protein RsbU (phosphoserine phosphatase)
MYFSSETGRAKLLETKGDNFPLGILEECDYQETQLKLESGDRVVFYTDGIVEAMNEKEEIFGFDRLLDVLQNAGPISADELLREILNKVKLFAGNAPQHDDLTLIVVGAE